MDILLGGMGIGTAVHRALTSTHFLSSPHEAAREMWERSGYVLMGRGIDVYSKHSTLMFIRRYLATNEAITRTSVLGVVNFNGTVKLFKMLLFKGTPYFFVTPPQT